MLNVYDIETATVVRIENDKLDAKKHKHHTGREFTKDEITSLKEEYTSEKKAK